MKSTRFLQIAGLILIAAGAQPAYSALWQWSKTANTNASADPSINWAEGMSPSSVNDSARAMMARMAEYRDDISGLLIAGGSGTAYTVTTNQGLNAAPNDGQLLAITVNFTNGTNATLTADGGNAYPLQTAPTLAIPAASLIAGSSYTVKFSVANSAWMLRDFYSTPLSIPLGGLMPYTLGTIPNSNYVFPVGQCLSTITYSSYWAALGSPVPGACLTNQFQILDLRGRIPAGLDTFPGFAAANRLTSSATGCGTAMTAVGVACANGNESHTLLTAEMPSHNHTITDPGHVHPVQTPNVSPGAGPSGTVVGSTSLGSTGSATTGITINNAGGGGPHTITPPIVGVTYILRVL